MNPLTAMIRAAQRRLWINRWLEHFGWSMTVAATAWLVFLIAVRLFGLAWPLGWTAIGTAGLGLVASIVWTAMRRATTLEAAVTLDKAAGLRERVSSGLACAAGSDPFSQAVVADAERTARGLSVRHFVPIRVGRPVAFAAGAAVVGLAMVWLFPKFDLLGKAEAREQQSLKKQVLTQLKSEIAKPVEAMKNLIEGNPELKGLKGLDELERLAKQENSTLDPADLRREAIKKLDKVSDELKKQAAAERYQQMQDMKNRLQEMGKPSDPKSPAGKLMQALSDGDFKQAQDEVQKMKDKLATAKREGKSEAEVKKMEKQLDELAKKLEEAGGDKKLQEQMKQAGLSEADMKRVLDALNKKDSKQLQQMMKELEKKLQQQGMSQQQIDKLKKEMQKSQQNKQSKNNLNKMSDAMKKAASQCKNGNSEGAQQQLDEAAEQLSEMEAMEQQLGEIESKMSELDDMKDKLGENDSDKDGDQECKSCNGSGRRKDGSPCPHCNGTGQCGGDGKNRGPGGRGRGAGDRPKGSGDVAFEKKRAKTHQRTGVIISQWYIKGEQLKGEAKAEFEEAVQAAERDASDALDKDQVPRAYQKAVKTYFDRLGDEKTAAPAAKDEKKPEKP